MTAASSQQVRRARDGTLVIFAANGIVLTTWLSRLPDVKSMMHLTPGSLGLLILSISIGSLIGLPLAGRLLDRMGPVRVARVGASLAFPCMVVAAVAAVAGWPLPTAMLALSVVGFGIGIWDVAQNLEGSVVEQALGRSIMPWFHAAFSGGAVGGALVAVVLIRLDVPLLAHVIGMVAVCAALVSWSTRRFLAAEPVRVPEGSRAEPTFHRSPWTEPRTLLIGVMVLAAAFTEGTANDWLAVAFVDGHGVSTPMGVAALTVFLVFMTTGRLVGTALLDRFGRVPVLRTLFVCALVGSALVVFGSTPVAYIGAAVWGFGSSLGFPVGMSAASDDPGRAAARLSVVATIGYGAFLAGPAIIGFLGDYVGVLRALSVVGLVSAVALLVVPAARPLDVSPHR